MAERESSGQLPVRPAGPSAEDVAPEVNAVRAALGRGGYP